MNSKTEKIEAVRREIDKMVQALADSRKVPAMQSSGAEDKLKLFDPVFDGAFNPEKYIKSPTRILFIGQEPGCPGDGGWDYGGTPALTENSASAKRASLPDRDSFFAFMNAVANGILNGDFSIAPNLDAGAPLYNTALINISNLPREAYAGLDGNMSRLYRDNREILEKKLSLYAPDVVVCHNTASVIWDSLQRQLSFDNYEVKYFSGGGKEIPLGQNNEPVEAPAAAVYYCDTKKIIIDVYRPGYQIRDGIPGNGWIAGALGSFAAQKPPAAQAENPAAVCADTAQAVTGKTQDSEKKGKPSFLLPLIIAAILVLLLLALLRFCKSPEKTPTAVPPAAEIVKAPETPPPVPVFAETTEVLFVKDSVSLLPSAADWLDSLAGELARHIEQNPSASFRITGYTAVFPGLPDPAELSLERAAAIAKELSARGIALNKLEAVGGGETDQWGNNSGEENRRPNRRIVIERK